MSVNRDNKINEEYQFTEEELEEMEKVTDEEWDNIIKQLIRKEQVWKLIKESREVIDKHTAEELPNEDNDHIMQQSNS